MLTAILRTGLLARSLTHGAELKFTAKNQTLITMSIFFNFCAVIDDSLGGLWHGVKNALGILHLASIHQLSDIKFAISLSPSPMNDLETSAQEQHVYKLTEDDDAPPLTVDEEVK
ncbi:hypothetical protein NC653_036332 [Populus alba x Populus x berolinensis]|uniref:Uncharacterized protein n=1 Tax=Populus alba x Populus x berolinensis TaxID=444605 RepID=A0AAD6LJM6_9ROSI|nr:hypothetical protein NC653_036332 [Populus alba x Populus x berolinensis]